VFVDMAKFWLYSTGILRILRNTWFVYSSSKFVADKGSIPRLISIPLGKSGPDQLFTHDPLFR
jgi:hypothetical protein